MENVDDEKNIQKYWGENDLGRVSSLDRLSYDRPGADSRNIFSSHPPFNFIIKYGAQEGSLTTVARNRGTSSDQNYEMIDRLMSLDFNDRLSQTSSKEMSIVLQSIHLTSMSTNYSPGGNPLVESYQFIGRDMYISEGTNKMYPTDSKTVTNDGSYKQNPRDTVPPPPTEQELRDRADEARSLNDYT